MTGIVFVCVWVVDGEREATVSKAWTCVPEEIGANADSPSSGDPSTDTFEQSFVKGL